MSQNNRSMFFFFQLFSGNNCNSIFNTACPENTYKSDERSCLPCPDNSFTNDTLANVLEGCVCQHGYTGNPGGPCVDVNECTEDSGTTGPCEQTCENRDGGYMCGCSIPGYVISDDKHTCKGLYAI